MNIDRILSVMNRHRVAYMLIGGMNFFLRHKPNATFDIDLWIEHSEANRLACEAALNELNASWGPTDETWQKVDRYPPGWLGRQSVYSMICDGGALDIFLRLDGIPEWPEAFARADHRTTPGGVPYPGLSDEDMLACQLVLDEADQKRDRIAYLQSMMNRRTP